MTRGVFIQGVISGAVSEPDSILYIKSLPQKELKAISKDLRFEKNRLTEQILREMNSDNISTLLNTSTAKALERVVAIASLVDSFIHTPKGMGARRNI